MTKNINIDESAHEVLLWAKEQIRKSGIDGPSHSDAIRYLYNLNPQKKARK